MWLKPEFVRPNLPRPKGRGNKSNYFEQDDLIIMGLKKIGKQEY